MVLSHICKCHRDYSVCSIILFYSKPKKLTSDTIGKVSPTNMVLDQERTKKDEDGGGSCPT